MACKMVGLPEQFFYQTRSKMLIFEILFFPTCSTPMDLYKEKLGGTQLK